MELKKQLVKNQANIQMKNRSRAISLPKKKTKHRGVIKSITKEKAALTGMVGEMGKRNDKKFHKDSVMQGAIQKKRSIYGQKVMMTVSKMITVDNIRKSAVGAIVSALFTLLGAILMWNFKRTGFYLYIAGIIIGIALPFYLYGNNLMAVGISSFSSCFGLVFIALYALNNKSFK